ncbi:carbon-nitrogen hydrolase family protein [Anaerobacillus isosaccharinicus]|uniref:Carbon-nitrogen hydrolase family protein n=1 Tax=Anaerobacillus isosaccharinicus TaxID=1532552 RepID=A0A1S2LLB6_9BACI|nr:carbon-nitrogen hydrolase family protein [Anaerobacillus isosaccharinicus]MBA5586171.1 carbon-nitrogen hydrolase family protein [Anaerobacillus isosaccharinicus]QOY38736.1 carbon-nitrogen hydrolase family protein [Anaerobacillus isosaccharinicus]
MLRVALLHLLPVAGAIEYNQNLIEKSIIRAAEKKVDWIITPELAVSGLQFSGRIGTDWITKQPDEWMTKLFTLAKSLNTYLFIGCPEKSEKGDLYNSVFVISKDGNLIGSQRKFTSYIDDWSTSGMVNELIEMEHVNIGVLICADAYTKEIAEDLRDKGAKIVVAPSSWGPGMYGPNGEWEQRSIDTGLPLFVCNRTGEDETVSFWEAESLVIKNGKRILSHKSTQSAILIFEWDLESMDVTASDFDVDFLV